MILVYCSESRKTVFEKQEQFSINNINVQHSLTLAKFKQVYRQLSLPHHYVRFRSCCRSTGSGYKCLVFHSQQGRVTYTMVRVLSDVISDVAKESSTCSKQSYKWETTLPIYHKLNKSIQAHKQMVARSQCTRSIIYEFAQYLRKSVTRLFHSWNFFFNGLGCVIGELTRIWILGAWLFLNLARQQMRLFLSLVSKVAYFKPGSLA